ncbi:MAG: PqqD family protein [Elusimicrobia bacterium]|nr:PqqD family protein [Elusimicrobiota bacterium]
MMALYLRRPPDVVWRQIDEYGVLLNVTTGDYCEVNELGLFVWRQLDDELSLDEIARRVAAAFESAPADVASDVEEFARGLEKRRMLVISERSPGADR